MSTINQRIAQVVEHSGLTKTAFAERIGVSASFVSLICKGGSNVSDRTLNDICREFSVDPLWLRTGEGEMIRPMSRELQIHAYLTELMGGSRTAAEEAFISTMARLPSQFWPMVEQALDTLLEEYSKSKKDKE
ncbi:MAG: helix-turn-helix transcriptional regulator [Ruminococcaceae bacterium]|nr:helix-turn-helix transcriptional regulator [Oscillospiraceae bacterium]